MYGFILLIAWSNFGFWTCYSKYLSSPHISGRISLNLQWWYPTTNTLATGELWIKLIPCKFSKYLHTAKSEERPTLQLKLKNKLRFIKINLKFKRLVKTDFCVLNIHYLLNASPVLKCPKACQGDVSASHMPDQTQQLSHSNCDSLIFCCWELHHPFSLPNSLPTAMFSYWHFLSM